MSQNQTDTPQFEIVKASEATEAITRAEIDVQIATAHRFPRDIAKFQREAQSLVTADLETAEQCFYQLDRSGKSIPGESVRLAEIAASAFGNLRVYGRVISIEEKWVVAQGLAHDLEKNVCYAAEVRRRITKSDGTRFNDDMIVVTCNAAIAIATRNATFKAIPRALLKSTIEAAEKLIRGDLQTLPERRGKAVEWFEEHGVKTDALFKYIGVGGITSIDLDKLGALAGLKTRIEQEGQEAVNEINSGVAPAAGDVASVLKSVSGKKDAKEGKKVEPKTEAKTETKVEPAAPLPHVEAFNNALEKAKETFEDAVLAQVLRDAAKVAGLKLKPKTSTADAVTAIIALSKEGCETATEYVLTAVKDSN